MTANVMNCFGLKQPVTAEMLLGIPVQERQQSFAGRSTREKYQMIDDAWTVEMKRRLKAQRKRLHK